MLSKVHCVVSRRWRRLPWRLLLPSLLLSLTLTPASAIAQKGWATQSQQGHQALKAKKYRKALAKFASAYRAKDTPAGETFQMGCKDVIRGKPVHEVSVKTFSIMRTEVTVAQHRACVRDRRCRRPVKGGECNWGKAGRDEHPINCINWNQARSFCRWAGGRLPSDAEWEFAARGGDGLRYQPWGNEAATCARVVLGRNGSCTKARPCGCGKNHTWPVCSKKGGNTAQGLCDMVGNVWEFTADCWHNFYDGAPVDGSAWVTDCSTMLNHRGTTSYMVTYRGGGWKVGAKRHLPRSQPPSEAFALAA